ncbi:hypothetical protein HELRODRAFT_183134 [Helobdella robusta]|uniref:Uncharacterized protein n=1 Tax=Helobdella robusta TaxID=6412 RepID=T1FJ66_HELRO|nr:hypothetical protein HELRODRAFT_183134 [Helobdella robusta]ESN89851.1 hypothetical protein HELRODRAFT_183134 [Helobdella robusta]
MGQHLSFCQAHFIACIFTQFISRQLVKIPNKKIDLLARLPNVIYSSVIYNKYLLSWFKRFGIISNFRLLAFKSRKHAHPLFEFDLVGCDLEVVVKESYKYKYAVHIYKLVIRSCRLAVIS